MIALRAALMWLVAIRRRLLLLFAFAVAFLLAAASARVLAGTSHGHVDLDRIFEVGGATLASVYLLAGWLIGRFPLIAVIVLMAGVFADERASGLARLHLSRPVSPAAFYGVRVLVLGAIAFLFSMLVMPAFDLVLLGQTQPGVWALVLAWIVVYGGITAALSVCTRADAWIALLIAALATMWHALRVGGILDAVPVGGRQFVTLVLPPHGALIAIETAFAQLQPIPWPAVLDACLYGVIALLLGALLLERREI
jgi:hypothetical protein